MFLVTKIVTDDATHYCNIVCEDDPHLITIKDIFTEETFRPHGVGAQRRFRRRFRRPAAAGAAGSGSLPEG